MTDKEKYEALTNCIVKAAVEARRAYWETWGKVHEAFTANAHAYTVLAAIVLASRDSDFWEKFSAAVKEVYQ